MFLKLMCNNTTISKIHASEIQIILNDLQRRENKVLGVISLSLEFVLYLFQVCFALEINLFV